MTMQTMQTVLLEPDTHLRIRYSVPRNGLIEFTVEAGGAPVDTYILDEEGLKEFNKGGDVSYYGGFTNRYEHHQELRLPFRGSWYLLIVNRNSQPVAVHYDVSG